MENRLQRGNLGSQWTARRGRRGSCGSPSIDSAQEPKRSSYAPEAEGDRSYVEHSQAARKVIQANRAFLLAWDAAKRETEAGSQCHL